MHNIVFYTRVYQNRLLFKVDHIQKRVHYAYMYPSGFIGRFTEVGDYSAFLASTTPDYKPVAFMKRYTKPKLAGLVSRLLQTT